MLHTPSHLPVQAQQNSLHWEGSISKAARTMLVLEKEASGSPELSTINGFERLSFIFYLITTSPQYYTAHNSANQLISSGTFHPEVTSSLSPSLKTESHPLVLLLT